MRTEQRELRTEHPESKLAHVLFNSSYADGVLTFTVNVSSESPYRLVHNGTDVLALLDVDPEDIVYSIWTLAEFASAELRTAQIAALHLNSMV